ncbi:Hypothetical predicted protein [Pelobates cultripes]|uniref:Uncharacterized protein n=1 Tax=Pelobates cultripes TaxID=61616 RepID=A0AAD1S838_PELCU|nr:Hypothetical predicted protein [Pelobates cultripes]
MADWAWMDCALPITHSQHALSEQQGGRSHGTRSGHSAYPPARRPNGEEKGQAGSGSDVFLKAARTGGRYKPSVGDALSAIFVMGACQ